MILRNVAIRHGRKALAPLKRSFFRTLNTESLSSSSGFHDAQSMQAEAQAMQAVSNQLYGATKLGLPSEEDAAEFDVVKEEYARTQDIKKATTKLGAIVDKHHYEPYSLVFNPPGPKDVTLELLMASQSHLGHSTSLWNPANQRYIFGVRQGIHIISLEETAAHLRRAAKVVEGVAYHGGLILFVGTRAGQSSAVVKAAQLAKGCHLFERWTPGSITNRDQILGKCAIKVVDKDDNEIVKGYEEKLSEWMALKPDLVVCLNPLENYILLHECGSNNIPTIGIIDTDADPTWVTYPIPANDDSLRCVQVIAGVLGRAGESGQQLRLEAAKNGQVTWRPPPGLGKPVTEVDKKKAGAFPRKPRKPAESVESMDQRSRPRGRRAETDDDDL